MKNFLLISLLYFSCLFSCTSGQEEDSIKIYLAPETVVTGTRIEQDQNKLPVSITVINKNEMENSADVNVLPLINNLVPGLFLNNRTILGFGVGPVSSGEISIRGIGQEPNTGILVLIDGQPQYMGIFGHPINDSYLKENIEQIEVIRGPASLLYGTNAVGGAINLITRKQKSEGLSLHSSFTYGSYNTSVFSGSAGYKHNQLSFVAAYTYSATDGHREDADDMYKSNSLFSGLSYAFSESYRLSVDANLTGSKFYDPGTEKAVKFNNYYDYTRGRIALALENFHPFGSGTIQNLEGAVRVYYNYGTHNFFDGWYSTDNFTGISLYQSLNYFGMNIFTAGVEYKNYGGKGENKNIPPPAAIGLNKKLSVQETEAYGIFQLSMLVNFTLSGGLRATKNSVYGFEYTPQFGFIYNLDDKTIIKGNAGKSFRSPTIADLFLFPPSNENLKPEKLYSYELGITKYLLQNKVKGELTFFYLEADNIIRQVAALRNQKNNTDGFNNKGIEFIFSFLPTGKFAAQLNYAYIKTSRVLPYSPEHKMNIHLEYDLRIFTLSSDVQSIFGLYPGGGIKKQDYTIISAGMRSSLTKNLNLFLKTTNLTNKKYYIDEGYPSPGIYFLAGIKLNF